MVSNVMQAVIFKITLTDIQPEQISKQCVVNTQQMIIKFNLMYLQYGPIFTLYGSNDVFPRKEVLLGVTTIDDVIWGKCAPKTP